jgi:methylated-DNA-[protein]-cysteine S-methyltransferase
MLVPVALRDDRSSVLLGLDARRVLSTRAVGLANGANPIAIVIPCHRVIGTNASLTGYGGGLDRKRWLLAHESACSASRGALGTVVLQRTALALCRGNPR